MKKKLVVGILTSSMLLSGISVLADKVDNVEITPINLEIQTEIEHTSEIVEDTIITLEGIETYKKEDTEMVPLREVAEDMLGLKVKWNHEEQKVDIGEGPNFTSIKIGENSYFFAKVAPFELSQAPELKEGLTYVPVEFFTNVLKYKIKFEEEKEERVWNGFIKEINNTEDIKSILVAGDENSQFVDEIILHVSDDTIIEDKEGNKVSFDDLKLGTKIETILPKIMTMSLPPQGSASKIIVTSSDVQIKKVQNEENIRYIEIVGLENTEIEKEINEKIKEEVEKYKENKLYEDLKLDISVGFLNSEKISLDIRGAYEFGENEKYIVKSLNINLENGEEITFENFFKKDEESQEKLEEILNKQAKEQGLEGFEAEGKWIKFKGAKVIVFYYELDDSATYPTELYIPLEEIRELIK